MFEINAPFDFPFIKASWKTVTTEINIKQHNKWTWGLNDNSIHGSGFVEHHTWILTGFDHLFSSE